MDLDYMKESKDGLIKYEPEVVEHIRKEYNFSKNEDRENAIAIIDAWIKQQDHFLKKDFSKGYIERCLITSKGSLERAKKQIERVCTVKTLMPKYFDATSLKKSDISTILHKFYVTVLPKLTDEYYRVFIFQMKKDEGIESQYQFTLFYKLLFVMAEYLKSIEYCRGYVLVFDYADTNISGVLTKINLFELQQVQSALSEGFGCRIKSILMVTASKFIETFFKLMKPIFSEKINSRIHAVSSRKILLDLIHGDILPEDYGGPEKPMAQMHDKFVDVLSSEPVHELLKEMQQVGIDVSKRPKDYLTDQSMGMPGTFRTLSLD